MRHEVQQQSLRRNMLTRSKAFLSCSAVTIALALALFMLTTRPPNPVVTRGTDTPDERLHTQVAKLQQHVGVMQSRLALAEAALAQDRQQDHAGEENGKPPAEPEPPSIPTWNERQQRDQQLVEATQNALEDVLEISTSEHRWTRDTRDLLESLLAEPELLASKADEVDCREALCRIAVQHDGTEAWMAFQRALSRPPFDGDHFFHYDSVTQRTTIYVAPPGESLPTVDRM
jgi:hypothetical protein